MGDISLALVHDAVQAVAAQQAIIAELRKKVFIEGLDYGVIPGSEKPALLKPGAEKIAHALKLYPVATPLTVIEDWEAPLFFYRYRVDLVHRETGQVYGSGIGSCNSRESKYGWRWVKEDQVPPDMDKSKLERRATITSEFKFAVEKAETSGPYGKPKAYWDALKAAIEAGEAQLIRRRTKSGQEREAYEFETVLYRVPNPDIFSLVNTIDKMAFKRALVAAALIAGGVSDVFTQDVEEMPEFVDVIEGQYTVLKLEDDLPGERELLKQMLIPSRFESVEALAHRIQELGYQNYDAMRAQLSFAQCLKRLTSDGQPAE